MTLDECPVCGADVELFDHGVYKGYSWHHYKCTECEFEQSDEPDWDSMPGGHDDY